MNTFFYFFVDYLEIGKINSVKHYLNTKRLKALNYLIFTIFFDTKVKKILCFYNIRYFKNRNQLKFELSSAKCIFEDHNTKIVHKISNPSFSIFKNLTNIL